MDGDNLQGGDRRAAKEVLNAILHHVSMPLRQRRAHKICCFLKVDALRITVPEKATAKGRKGVFAKPIPAFQGIPAL